MNHRRSSDKLSSKLPALAVKALYVLVIAVCVACSYFVFMVDDSLWGLVYSVLFCIPAGMALVELFPGKWKGIEE